MQDIFRVTVDAAFGLLFLFVLLCTVVGLCTIGDALYELAADTYYIETLSKEELREYFANKHK